MGMSADATICFGVAFDLEGHRPDEYFTSLASKEAAEEALDDLLWDLAGAREGFFDLTSFGHGDYGSGYVLYARGTDTETEWGTAPFYPHELAKMTTNLLQAWGEELERLKETYGATDLLVKPQWLLVPYYG